MSPRTHAYPVFAQVRCRIGDVRVGARQVRIGQIVRHELSHGVVLVTGRRAKRMRLWESQLETSDQLHSKGRSCLVA